MNHFILQQNPFEVFELTPSFSIKEGVLKKKYIELQQAYHPDQLQDDKVSPMQLSAHINDVYQQLKQPRLRAQWLLEQKNITVNIDNATHKPNPTVLMESMEQREKLMELDNITDLSNYKKHIKKLNEVIISDLAEAFEKQDYENAAIHTIRLRYSEKLLEEIKIKQHALMDA